jgi:hypothetical protein
MDEAKMLMERQVEGTGRKAYSPETAVKFKASDNVFVKSALAVDFTYRKATVTLPLFRGLSPMGEPVYYIITEASDFEVAKQMGINFAPKMKHALGTPGAQRVTVSDGVMKFKGNVDFAPKHTVVAARRCRSRPRSRSPARWPISSGHRRSRCRVASCSTSRWSATRRANHDRVKDIDLKKQTVTLSLLDGFQGGKQYYYHLVTDVSADLPAVLEKGVYAPKLALLPELGKSKPSDKSALLGFSPVLNGMTDMESKQDQGFTTTLANGRHRPDQHLPHRPRQRQRVRDQQLFPMWDAHVNMWTEAAVKDKKVRRITSFEDLKSLMDAGLVTSAMINPPGPGNPFVHGLRPTNAIINCPVIAHPVLSN